MRTNKSSINNHDQQGFTIVELMIATTIFVIILMVVSVGITAIGRLYFKNETSARTQEAVRSAIEEAARTVQFSNAQVKRYDPDIPPPPAPQVPPASANVTRTRSICVGDTRFTFKMNTPLTTGRHILWVDKLLAPNTCPTVASNFLDTVTPSTTGTDTRFPGRELLGNNMRLLNFDISEVNTVVSINIRVAYGDNDLLDHYRLDGSGFIDLSGSNGAPDLEDLKMSRCRSNSQGGAFCSISELDTNVKRRIN